MVESTGSSQPSTSQVTTGPLGPPAAQVQPSGERAIQLSGPTSEVSTCCFVPLAVSEKVTVLWRATVASSRPAGWKAKWWKAKSAEQKQTWSLCGTGQDAPVAASRRTSPPFEAQTLAASSLLSGLKANRSTQARFGSLNASPGSRCPVATSQRKTPWFAVPAARVAPSGEKARLIRKSSAGRRAA